jgi:type IV secretion system protein VirD4
MRSKREGRWLLRGALAGWVFLELGWLARRTSQGPFAFLIGVALFVMVIAVWRHRRAGSAAMVQRWSRRTRRQHGVASWREILRTSSRFAVRRQMQVLRPSLRYLPWWKRCLVPTRAVATPLARVGVFKVWSPIEDATLRFGGPRVGKSGELACRILDAPGAVIATSTRTDLVDLTRSLRAVRGPVHIFNPSGVGGLPSTVTFDPVVGCEVPKTAFERARDLIAGGDAGGGDATGERQYWATQARRVLMALLHAAALSGGSMRDVQAWVADPEAHAHTIQRYLRRSPEPAFEADLMQFVTTNDRTRSSISTTIMPSLSWLTDETAARAAGQDVGREPQITEAGVTVPDVSSAAPVGLDVEALLALSGTVYLLGAQDSQVAPLVTALTGHLARVARQIAGRQPSGRLDPPLTLALDEAALICPIPLDEWTADMGGRNVTIHIAAQSRPQLRMRWGQDGAAAILNNAATLLIYGGTRDAEDLQVYSTLAGEREEGIETRDWGGRVISATSQRVSVLAPAQIAQLPSGKVLIIRRGMHPAIGTVQMAWERRDVRHVQRRERRTQTADRRRAVRARRAASRRRRQAWVIARSGRVATLISMYMARFGESRRPPFVPPRAQERGTSDD